MASFKTPSILNSYTLLVLQLSAELAKLSVLSERQINTLLPRKVDKIRLQKLINIVNGVTTQNEKLASLKDNFEDLGEVVLKLLSKFLK